MFLIWDAFVEADNNTATPNITDDTREQELIAAVRGQPTSPQDQPSSSEDEAIQAIKGRGIRQT